MAILKSDIITAREALAYSDKTGADGIKIGANILLATAVITLASTTAANDLFELVDLPAGVEVVPQLSHVTLANPGTTLTVDIGDDLDDDRYADGIVLSAGGRIPFASTAATVGDAVANPHKTKATTRIRAKVMTASAINANVKAVFTIAYRITG